MTRNLKSSNISVNGKISAGFDSVHSILFKIESKEPVQSPEKSIQCENKEQQNSNFQNAFVKLLSRCLIFKNIRC